MGKREGRTKKFKEWMNVRWRTNAEMVQVPFTVPGLLWEERQLGGIGFFTSTLYSMRFPHEYNTRLVIYNVKRNNRFWRMTPCCSFWYNCLCLMDKQEEWRIALQPWCWQVSAGGLGFLFAGFRPPYPSRSPGSHREIRETAGLLWLFFPPAYNQEPPRIFLPVDCKLV